MSNFTKGPWKILPEELHRPYIRVRGTVWGGRYKIANVMGISSEGGTLVEKDVVEVRANANLIVAAPEMYEALKEYDDLDAHRLVCEECRDTPEVAAEACSTCFPFADRARLLMRAAIAKAEGKFV